MKKALFALMLFSCSIASAQKLIISLDQPIIQHYTQWDVDGNPTIHQRDNWNLPLKYTPVLNLSYYGLTTSLHYVPGAIGFTWSAGYTLTITPGLCLRTHGEGFQLGLAFGRSTYQQKEKYNSSQYNTWWVYTSRISMAWQSSKFTYGIYGELIDAWSGAAQNFGLRFGYAIL